MAPHRVAPEIVRWHLGPGDRLVAEAVTDAGHYVLVEVSSLCGP